MKQTRIQKENKRHSHKPSQLPSYANTTLKHCVEKLHKQHEFELDTETNETNEANISFQMTAQSFQVKRSYLDKVEVPTILREHSMNVCEELAASPSSQFGQCSKRCTLLAGDNTDFYCKHTVQASSKNGF